MLLEIELTLSVCHLCVYSLSMHICVKLKSEWIKIVVKMSHVTASLLNFSFYIRESDVIYFEENRNQWKILVIWLSMIKWIYLFDDIAGKEIKTYFDIDTK